MKTLSKHVILDRNHAAMVRQERALLARLHCPQLVNLHYAFQDKRNLYLVMDACLGGDLHFQLMRAPGKCFAEARARFYVASIIVCLEYMHGANVLHRDVKPENLLLDGRGQLKMTDLGISMELNAKGECTSTSGTRPYMAPEIFMSGHRHGRVADYYSLGITTYQFLVGSRPYRPESTNMRAIVRMATYVPPDKYTDMRQIRRILIAAQEKKATVAEFQYSRRLSAFSAEARDFVQSCLVCNPTYRLGSGGVHELLEHPWFADIDWPSIRNQTASAPFIPDTTVANCALSADELNQMLLNDDEQELGPEIRVGDQALFQGYDFRTLAEDDREGRIGDYMMPDTVSSAEPHNSNATMTMGPEEVAEVGGAAYSRRRTSDQTVHPGDVPSPIGSLAPSHASAESRTYLESPLRRQSSDIHPVASPSGPSPAAAHGGTRQVSASKLGTGTVSWKDQVPGGQALGAPEPLLLTATLGAEAADSVAAFDMPGAATSPSD
jgi:serine/threonine protein kinase